MENSTIINTSLHLNFLFVILISVSLLFLGEPEALIYTTIFFFFFLVIAGADKYKRKSIPYYISILFCITLLTVIIGLRDFGIGTDTDVYIKPFFYNTKWIHNISDFISTDGDLGFVLLAFISKSFSDDPQSLLVITELWICLFTFAGIHEINSKYKRVEWTTFLLLWLFTFLNASMNLMRQYCAMAMLLLAFAFLLNNKWKKAIVLQVLSYFFHSSAIIFVPIFGILYLSKWENRKRRNLYTAILLLFALLLITQIFIVLPFLANIGIISNLYADRYGIDSDYSSTNIFGVGIITLYVLGYLLIFKSVKEGILKENEAYIAFCIHTLFFILRLLAFYVGYLSRLSAYYYYIDIFMISIILSHNRIPLWLKCGYYICILYLWYKEYILMPGGYTYPFKSTILGI